MTFTEYYFNYGYNTTMEKEAARKKKESGMSPAMMAALGIGGAGLLGGLGYAGHEGLLGEAAQDFVDNGIGEAKNMAYNAPAMMARAKEAVGEAGQAVADKAGDLAAAGRNTMYNAPAMLARAEDAISEAGHAAADKAGDLTAAARDYIANMNNPAPLTNGIPWR